MKKTISLITILFCAWFTLSANAMTDTQFQNSILTEVNQFRTQHGLSPLKMNRFLSAEAAQHSRDMAAQSVPFGHHGFNNRMRAISAHFDGMSRMAENVIYSSPDPKRMVELWLNSPGHRKNISGKYYRQTGIGLAWGDHHMLYVTQIFIS